MAKILRTFLVLLIIKVLLALDLQSYKTEKDILNAIDSLIWVTGKKQYSEICDVPIEKDVRFFCSQDHRYFRQIYLSDSEDGLKHQVAIDKNLTFIIHGFRGKWYKDFKFMARYYLGSFDATVCVVDWERLAKFDYGTTARKNIFLVSDHISDLIKRLNKIGYSYGKMTLVGHSLGSHIAGLVGQSVGGQIDQIIGLDVAGPLFTYPELKNESMRLDKSDAKFVQAIYTTMHQFGTSLKIGHQNFFPNGGMSPQPDCYTWYTYIWKSNPKTIQCSHKFAFKLFTSSINHAFIGKKCNDVSGDKNKDVCNSNVTDVLGFQSKR